MAGTGASGSYGAATITTSAGLIAGGRGSRNGLVVQNNHASNDLYLGTDSSVTTSTGVHVVAGGSMDFPDYAGPVYGIASASGTDVRYFEAF